MIERLGTLTWDLPSSIQYIPTTPPTEIPITFTITNISDDICYFAIFWLGVSGDGLVVSLGDIIAYEEIEEWLLEPGESSEISVEIVPDFTDAYLSVVLIGLTEEMVEAEERDLLSGSLATYLSSVALPSIGGVSLWEGFAMLFLMVFAGVVVTSIVREKK